MCPTKVYYLFIFSSCQKTRSYKCFLDYYLWYLLQMFRNWQPQGRMFYSSNKVTFAIQLWIPFSWPLLVYSHSFSCPLIRDLKQSLTPLQTQASWYCCCAEHNLIAKQVLGHIHFSLQSLQYHKPTRHQPTNKDKPGHFITHYTKKTILTDCYDQWQTALTK